MIVYECLDCDRTLFVFDSIGACAELSGAAHCDTCNEESMWAYWRAAGHKFPHEKAEV